MALTQQGFPQINAPLVRVIKGADNSPVGLINDVWYYLLKNLWDRTGQALGFPLLFQMFEPGTAAAGAISGWAITDATTFGVGFAGSVARSLIAATSATVVNLNRVRAGVSVTIGTVTFAAGSTLGVFYSTGGVTQSLAGGDILQVQFPNPADGTLADIYITLRGVRT